VIVHLLAEIVERRLADAGWFQRGNEAIAAAPEHADVSASRARRTVEATEPVAAAAAAAGPARDRSAHARGKAAHS